MILGISTKETLCSVQQSPRLNVFAESSIHTPQVAVVSGGVESVLTSPSPPGNRIASRMNCFLIVCNCLVPHRKRKKSLQPSQPPNSSRASVVLPLLTNTNPFNVRRVNDDNICKCES